MIRIGAVVVVMLIANSIAWGQEDEERPQGPPPLVGRAMVTDVGNDDPNAKWVITLEVPQVRWRIKGEVVPKREWPRLDSEVSLAKLDLKMGGPSQLAPSSLVDIGGMKLSRAQVLERLKEKQPVLVSVTGEMPDPYYLALARQNAIIILLGARDGAPLPDLLPAKALERG